MCLNSNGNGTGLFYAYATNEINDDWSWRCVIVFATRDVADTWYRRVTDSVAAGYTRFRGVRRVSLQFFTHNPGEGPIVETINDDNVARDLRGKIFFTLIDDRGGRGVPTIPILNYAENNSGNRFYVRSVAQPDSYWWYDPSTSVVVASKGRRTLFIITLADTNKGTGTVMIGSDDILLTADGGVNIGNINDQNQFGRSNNPFPFRFASFSGDFKIDCHGHAGCDCHEGPNIISRNPGQGERWELV